MPARSLAGTTTPVPTTGSSTAGAAMLRSTAPVLQRPWPVESTTPGRSWGMYLDAAGKSHGFLLSGGSLTTIDVPNATSTECSGINDNGQIVGDYIDAAGKNHGFLLSAGAFTYLNYPRAIYTQAFAINLAGQIVGRYQSTDGKEHGFRLSGGTYTAIDFPGANRTSAEGINDAGEIVGFQTMLAGIPTATTP